MLLRLPLKVLWNEGNSLDGRNEIAALIPSSDGQGRRVALSLPRSHHRGVVVWQASLAVRCRAEMGSLEPSQDLWTIQDERRGRKRGERMARSSRGRA